MKFPHLKTDILKDWRTQILDKNIPQTGIFKTKKNHKKMNTFTITFRTEQGLLASLDFNLKMHSVNAVKEWFEEGTNKTARSITKH